MPASGHSWSPSGGAPAGTYQEAEAGGYTDSAVNTYITDDGGAGLLNGFTVTLALDGVTVTTFSLSDDTMLPFFMASGEGEDFDYDMSNSSGAAGFIHMNDPQFAEQSCSAVAW
jgi:hypothetical protein